MVGKTRSAIHDTGHHDHYWNGELCPDAETRQKIKESCPHGALVEDRRHPGELHLHIEQCNQCLRCLQVAPLGSLKIEPATFEAFHEANAISVAIALGTFAKEKATHMVLATHMTPVCDCFGFTSMPILPDAGIFGSDDIIALDEAVLDMTAKTPLIEENVPASMEVHTRVGHPLRWLHGPFKDPYKVLEFGENRVWAAASTSSWMCCRSSRSPGRRLGISQPAPNSIKNEKDQVNSPGLFRFYDYKVSRSYRCGLYPCHRHRCRRPYRRRHHRHRCRHPCCGRHRHRHAAAAAFVRRRPSSHHRRRPCRRRFCRQRL